MEIMKITEKDKEKVVELISSIINNEFNIGSDIYNYNDLNDICKYYSGNRDIFYIAKDDYDEIVGTIAIKEDDEDTALLRRIFVSKKMRQRGCGLKLLKKALKFAFMKGYKKVAFRCADKMSAAINLVIKNNFIEKDVINTGKCKIFLLEKNI